MSESLIDFYKKHQISPVRQDISDLEKHFERRASLYRHLGILPSFMKGKRALEVGPGSGYNSLFTASLSPSAYTLVEGNPRGVADIEKLFSDFPELRKRITIEHVLLEEFKPKERFDFVFCEAMLCGLEDPKSAVKILASFVDDGGVLTITCVDDVSYLPEILRRLFAHMIVSENDSLETQLTKLLPVFSPHLATLKGMSRPHEDWIIDNLINPAAVKEVLSMPDAIQTIGDKFDFLGSSPHFIADWRWYKTIVGRERQINENAIARYWENVHSFLDHTRVFAPRNEGKNRELHELCREANLLMRSFETTRDRGVLKALDKPLVAVVGLINDFSKELAFAIEEARLLIGKPSLDTNALAKSSSFGKLFGRGQQYVSFSRR